MTVNPEESVCGETPLHIAASKADLEVVQYLVNQSINIYPKTYAGYEPLHYAAKSGNLEIFKYLFEIFEDEEGPERSFEEPLSFIAAEHGQIGILRYLEDQATDINEQNNTLFTPLHR